MKLTIFGASGAIGRLLTDAALASGHQVTAYVRRPEAFVKPIVGLAVVTGNLSDYAAIVQAIKGADAVISALGPALDMSRKRAGTPIADGHRVIVEAMKSEGVRRLVTLATPSVKADDDPRVLATILPGIMARLLFPNPYRDIVAVGSAV
jgi:putative NADH-flavin reductase